MVPRLRGYTYTAMNIQSQAVRHRCGPVIDFGASVVTTGSVLRCYCSSGVVQIWYACGTCAVRVQYLCVVGSVLVRCRFRTCAVRVRCCTYTVRCVNVLLLPTVYQKFMPTLQSYLKVKFCYTNIPCVLHNFEGGGVTVQDDPLPCSPVVPCSQQY